MGINKLKNYLKFCEFKTASIINRIHSPCSCCHEEQYYAIKYYSLSRWWFERAVSRGTM